MIVFLFKIQLQRYGVIVQSIFIIQINMIFALKNCIRSYDFSHPNVKFNHVKRQRIQAKERK